MATFKEIRGFTIKKYTTNPTNPLEGEVWYNSTAGNLKVYQNIGAAWSSATALNTAVVASKGWGPQTAATVAGGNAVPGTTGATQLYDGSTWTTSPASLSPVRSEGGVSQAGTQTAAWYSGGVSPSPPRINITSEFDGSAWTGGGTYPLPISMGGAGPLTAGLGFGGYQPATPEMFKPTTCEYDGTSWAAANNMTTGRSDTQTGVGIQTAALTAAGTSGPPAPLTNMVNSESYDGTSWTATNTLPVGRSSCSLFGTASIAKIFGGRTPPVPTISNTTADWDGTSWSASPATLATARVTMAGAGTTGTAGLCAGGNPPTLAVVEEYNDPSILVQTITTS